jgi:hypothetical protein
MERLRRSRLTIPVLLGFAVLCLYLVTASSDLRHNGDTLLRYQTTQAIVDHGRLWIESPYYTDTRVTRGLGGHYYAFYGPGQSLLMVPLYIAGKVVAHRLNLAYETATQYAVRSLDLILGALLAALFCWFALLLGYSRRVAVALTLVFAFASVAWPDAQSGLEQTQVNFFVFLATMCAWQSRRRKTSSNQWLAGCACCLGAAILTRYDAAMFVPVFAVFAAWMPARARNWRAAVGVLAIFSAALAPWVAALGLWNQLRFGSPFLTGLQEQTLGGSYLEHLFGLLVSPGKGLIWYLPLVFLLPWCVRGFARRDPALAALAAALVAVPLLFYSAILYWHGDPSWGPRYLYTAVPYLVLPLGELFSRWRVLRPSFRSLVAVAVLASVALNLAALSVTQWRFWYRLQAAQQSRVNEATWSGQPFRWGSSHYHYYWDITQSPIAIQFDNVFQIARLALGDEKYRLVTKPDPFTSSNTADFYPLNTVAFWWADPVHPLFGPRARAAIALFLGLVAALTMFLLFGVIRGPPPPRARRRPLSEAITTAERAAPGLE